MFAAEFKQHARKCLYFTATPRNANGIRMLPHKDGTPGDCGPILFRYSLYQAVQDGACKDFKVLVMFTDRCVMRMGSASMLESSCSSSDGLMWSRAVLG